MFAADHKVVRQLLTRFAIAKIAHVERETPGTARELAEVTRALCAMVERTSVYEAIATADEWLAGRCRPVVRPGGSGESNANANAEDEEVLGLAV